MNADLDPQMLSALEALGQLGPDWMDTLPLPPGAWQSPDLFGLLLSAARTKLALLERDRQRKSRGQSARRPTAKPAVQRQPQAGRGQGTPPPWQTSAAMMALPAGSSSGCTCGPTGCACVLDMGKLPKPFPHRQQAVQLSLDGDKGDAKGGAGHWVTIGGSKGSDGKRHGGTPVYVEGGRVTKGHPRLLGKRFSDDDGPKLKGAEEATTHRAAMKASREYTRARWAKQARQHGIEPEHLHALAGDFLRHDQEYTGDKHRLLHEAREALSEHGDVRTLHLRAARGDDADSFPGMDEVATDLAAKHPHLFDSRHGHPTDQLFDMLRHGQQRELSADDAYEQAFAHLHGDRQREQQEADRFKMQSGETVPF